MATAQIILNSIDSTALIENRSGLVTISSFTYASGDVTLSAITQTYNNVPRLDVYWNYAQILHWSQHIRESFSSIPQQAMPDCLMEFDFHPENNPEFRFKIQNSLILRLRYNDSQNMCTVYPRDQYIMPFRTFERYVNFLNKIVEYLHLYA